MTAARVDAWFSWLPVSWPATPLPLVTVPDACAADALPVVAGAAVLLPASPEGCSRGQAVLNMQNKGAKGVVLYPGVGQQVIAPNCQGSECELPLMV